MKRLLMASIITLTASQEPALNITYVRKNLAALDHVLSSDNTRFITADKLCIAIDCWEKLAKQQVTIEDKKDNDRNKFMSLSK